MTFVVDLLAFGRVQIHRILALEVKVIGNIIVEECMERIVILFLIGSLYLPNDFTEPLMM